MGFQTKENDLPVWWIDVDQFDADVITNYTGPGANPSNIFHVGETIQMRVTWRQRGTWFIINSPGWHWHVRAYLEKFGGGEAPLGPGTGTGRVDSFNIQQVGNPLQNSANLTLSSPPNNLAAGVYKVIVTLSLVAPGDVLTVFHAYEEAGILEVVGREVGTGWIEP